MKGSVIHHTPIKQKDPITGVTVTQLSDDQGNTNHSYFTMPSIDRENRFVVCNSDRTGTSQIYTLELGSGTMVQITEEKAGTSSGCLDLKRNIVYYMAGRELKSTRLDTLETRTHLEIPEGCEAGLLSITNDGRYLAFAYSEKVALITSRGALYSGMREKMFRHPASVIIRYDTQEEKAYAVWGEQSWISHVNISPIDPNRIVFCHEGTWHLVQRLWTAKVDTDEITPLVEQKYNMERVGHEFFLEDGRVGAQYTIRHDVHTNFFRDAHFGDVFVNPDGSNQQIYFYPYTRPMHFQMNHAMTMGAGDGAHIRRDMPDNRKYIGLNRYEDNQVKVGLLCRHNSSFKSQACHPHLIFTRDDRHVLFSSDFGEGNANVYLAEANWEQCIFG